MRRLAIVKDLAIDAIVDAIDIEMSAPEVDAIEKLNCKWAPVRYTIQTIGTEDPSRYFGRTELQTIERIIHDNLVKLVQPKEHRHEVSLNDGGQHSKYPQEELLRCLGNYGPDIVMVTGEVHPAVYDEDVYNAFRKVYSEVKQIIEEKTILLAGPILAVKDEYTNNRVEGNILPRLQKEKNCSVYYSDKRQPIHVRIGGKENIYLEEYHEAVAARRVSWFYEHDTYTAQKFIMMVNYLIEDGIVTRSEKPEDFLFVTMTEMKELKKAVNEEVKKGIIGSYDECTKADFLRIMKSLNHNYLIN